MVSTHVMKGQRYDRETFLTLSFRCEVAAKMYLEIMAKIVASFSGFHSLKRNCCLKRIHF